MPPAASPPTGLESLHASIEGLRAVVVALAASRGSSAGGFAKSTPGGGTGDASDRVQALHTQASLLFLDLRAANRAALESVERTREAALSAKRELDEQRLKLQCVQYEKGHVRKEIRTSSEFTSEFADEDVGLCDVSTFFAEAAREPGANADDAADPSAPLEALDAHALTLKRLAHELRRREALARTREALEKKKTALTRSVETDRAFLDGLRGELGALRTAFEPLRSKLGSERAASGFRSRMDARARDALRDPSLPSPLYVLFAALVAVAERGDASEHAGTTERTETDAETRARLVVSFETGGDDDETESVDDETGRGRKRARRDAFEDETDGKRRTEKTRTRSDTTRSGSIVPAPGAHEAHGTRVVLTLGATGVAVVFRYFPSLRVVTAEVRAPAEPAHRKKPAAKDDRRFASFARETLLVDLFPGDDGTRAPGAAVAGAADARLGRDDGDASGRAAFLSRAWDAGPNARRDRPFLWCQHLAGLDLTPLTPPPPMPPLADPTVAPPPSPATLRSGGVSFADAAAAERAVAAHAEQRRGATVVAALEARFIDAASLERGARRVAAAAEAKLGVSGLLEVGDAVEDVSEDVSAAAEPEPAAGGVSGNARAFLTSFRETFGEDAERESDEGDGGCFRWSGSPVAARLAATGDTATVAARGARRFAARVEVSNRPFGSASSRSGARESGGGARAQSFAFRDERTTRYLRFAIEVPASFPTRPASVALAVRVTSATVDDATNRPPPSPADADAEPSFDDELGAFANDARLAEAAANRVETEASTEASRERPSAEAALVRCVSRILRAAETYFPPLGAGGAAEEHGTRRGRERRKA